MIKRLTIDQALAAAFPSGKRLWPATSSTPRLRTTLARRSAALPSRIIMSAYTTRRRYVNKAKALEKGANPRNSTPEPWLCKLRMREPRRRRHETTPRVLSKYGTWDFSTRRRIRRRCWVRLEGSRRTWRRLPMQASDIAKINGPLCRLYMKME